MLCLQIETGVNLFFIAVMTGFLFYILTNSKRSRLLFNYCFAHTMTLLIVIVDFASAISPNISIRWGFLVVTYVLKLFYDLLCIIHIRPLLKPTLQRLTYIVNITYMIVGTAVIITNPWHHLFISKMTATENIFGVLYYVFMGIGCIAEIAGMFLVFQFWIKKLDNQSFRIGAAFIAVSHILVLHLYLTKLIPMPVDILPLLLLACFTVYFIGAYKYGMFGAIADKSNYGLEMFTDALIITDLRGKELFRNKTCELLEDRVLHDIFAQLRSQEHGNNKQKEIKTEVEVPMGNQTATYQVTQRLMRKKGLAPRKKLYLIHDNTSNTSALRMLSEKNQYLQEMNESIKDLAEDTKRLAVLSERNQMAKEIHDAMGHSLILALNTMESNRLLNDRTLAMQRIHQAVSEFGSSLDEIATERDGNINFSMESELYPEDNPERTGQFLLNRFSTLASRLYETGIELEITDMDDLDCCSETIVSSIYRTCQESVTNAIKHGKARRITMSVKKKQNLIDLFVVDNGIGCPEIKKGTGLTSMEERIRELNGTISFDSFEDHRGFMVHASIPV